MLKGLLTLSLILYCAQSISSDLNLPDLGGASGGLISAAQEYELGQQWQRVFRSQMRTSSDPFLQSYTEDLVRQLATHSDLSDKRLDILVVANPTLNAFAVPGGVVGVHTGLFQYAQTEQQFASVMAHELAHLSQRHFARQIDEQKNNAIPNFATMLASILVLATAGGEAGIAAVSASRALSIDSQLRFSRKMEQEADRLGMETLARAGMNPYAMSAMFEEMLHASRFQRRPPEFLITHPITESRVSDSKLRAQQYPKTHEQTNYIYKLIKVRAELAHESNLANAAKTYQGQLDANTIDKDTTRYALALALFMQNKFKEAEAQIDLLLDKDSSNLFYLIAKSEIDAEQGEFAPAINRLKTRLKNYPSNHPLNIKLAEIYMKAGKYKECEALLLRHSKRRPKDDYVWYLLAEAHGLSGNIFQVHTARAEYFLINGIYAKAENHLRNAIALIKDDEILRAQLDEKLKKVQRMKRESVL